jgi:hypothetical protein
MSAEYTQVLVSVNFTHLTRAAVQLLVDLPAGANPLSVDLPAINIDREFLSRNLEMEVFILEHTTLTENIFSKT